LVEEVWANPLIRRNGSRSGDNLELFVGSVQLDPVFKIESVDKVVTVGNTLYMIGERHTQSSQINVNTDVFMMTQPMKYTERSRMKHSGRG
jgi:hypothetical protein